MIYLYTPGLSGLGEDTFWTWFSREFETDYSMPPSIGPHDIAIVNAARNNPPEGGKKIALVFELYPEMKRWLGGGQYDPIINFMKNTSKKCQMIGCTSPVVYEDFQDLNVPLRTIPLGIDVELFRPMNNKSALRQKYGLPLNARIGFWSGTTHPMKGYDLLKQHASNNPDIFWVIVWKSAGDQDSLPPNAKSWITIPQGIFVELMNSSDFCLCANRLRPYFMVEWEAMACNLPFEIVTPTPREFIPEPEPRGSLFKYGWDRPGLKRIWEATLSELRGM